MITEADTCRQYVLPTLYGAGRSDEHIHEQKTFTDGRILVQGRNDRRGRQKRVDYLLYARREHPTAVDEAKATYLGPGQGLLVLPATKPLKIEKVGRVFGGLPRQRQVLDGVPQLIPTRERTV